MKVQRFWYYLQVSNSTFITEIVISIINADSPYLDPNYVNPEDRATDNAGTDRSMGPIGTDVGAIVGGVIGGIVFLIAIGVIAGIGLYCFWKKYYIYVYNKTKILICARNKKYKSIPTEEYEIEILPENEEVMDRGKDEEIVSLNNGEIKGGPTVKGVIAGVIRATMNDNGEETRKDTAKRNSSIKESIKKEEHIQNVDDTSETLGHQGTDIEKEKRDKAKGIHSDLGLGGIHSELEQTLKARKVDEESGLSSETKNDDQERSRERRDGGRERYDRERSEERGSREDRSRERRDRDDRSRERRDREDRSRERRDREDRSRERGRREDRSRDRRDREDRSRDRRDREDRSRDRRDREDRSRDRRDREDRSRERGRREDRSRERDHEDRHRRREADESRRMRSKRK